MQTATISQPRTRLTVKRGQSHSLDEATAVQELYEQIGQDRLSGVIFFASSKYNLDRLAKELTNRFDAPMIGCTTSGEIGPLGYGEGTLVGFSLSSDQLQMLTYSMEHLQQFDTSQIEEIGKSVRGRLAAEEKVHPGSKAFALLLIDGLSVREEQAISVLYHHLEGLPIIGGSAGDDLAFKQTHVFVNGQFVQDAAAVAVFLTTHTFKTFKMQHFVPTDRRLVVTAADPQNRIVTEINGKPAASEYARLLGIEINELQPMVFAKYPVMLKIGGEYYVRSIQKVNPDGSLTFFCAIDEGLVLTISQGQDLVATLERTLKEVTSKIPNPQVIIGCECILRRLEVLEKGLTKDVDALLQKYNLIGFHTYGEQFNQVHVNQTFTGVVLGE